MFCRPFEPALLLCAAWLGSTLALGAAAERAGIGPFRIQRWTTDEGLPQSHVVCLKQSRDGYLWIGTWAGAARFDGIHFTVFNKFNTPELVSDAINALAQDNEGTLWIGTRDGLVAYRDHKFERFVPPPEWAEQKIWRLAPRSAGGVWLQCGGQVGYFLGAEFSHPFQPHCDGLDRTVSLVEGADGWLNIFMDSAWISLSPRLEEVRTNYLPSRAEAGWLAGRAGDTPGHFLIGTGRGLRQLSNDGIKPIGNEDLNACAVDGVLRDRSGSLWVTARPGGLFRLEEEHWQPVMPGTQVNDCVEEDFEGNLWVGTAQCLLQIQPQPVRTYTAQDGLANDYVLSVCEGADGTIWAGTDRGLSCIREGQCFSFTGSEPVADYQDRCVWPNLEGGVWLAKQAFGLIHYRQGEFETLTGHAQLGGAVNSLFGDRAGRLWVGLDRGAIRLPSPCGAESGADRESAKPGKASGAGKPAGSLEAALFSSADPGEALLPGSLQDVRCFLEEKDGTFWVGTRQQGLTRLRGGQCSVFTTRDGLSHNDVWCLHQDSEGVIWIGTDSGLSRYKSGRFFSFTVRQGLRENTINCVLQDDDGHLWLSGLHGIYRVALSDLNAVADGRASRLETFTIGTADGMANAETNGGENQPAGWKARDGRLWFPTVRGLVSFDPKSFPEHEPAPQVVIEAVKANHQLVLGDAVFDDRTTRLPSAATNIDSVASHKSVHAFSSDNYQLDTARVLQFCYTANTFVEPGRARFRYRLVGMDADWREETTERTVSYFSLQPGQYRFEVIAANHHNVWSRSPASFAFYVAPPRFWQTSTFYLVCAGAVIGLAAAMQGYRLRWQRRLLKLEEQRVLASERARIARDLHDDLGTALTGLALELDVAGRDNSNAPLGERLKNTARRTRDLAERMREVVWTVNPNCDTVSSLASFLEQQVSQFLRADGVDVRLDFPEDIPPLPLGAEARHQLALSVREALTNVLRHAQATEVRVSLALEGKTLLVQVRDNGRGFQPNDQEGHGLANMRARLNRIGGTFECVSKPGAGSTLGFRLPLSRLPADERSKP